MAEDAKWYFVKDNRAANTKEYKTKMLKHNNRDTMTRRKGKDWYVELNEEGFDPRTPPWKLARDRDIAIKRASWDFKATYPKRAPQCEKQNLSVFKKYGSSGEIAASSEESEAKPLTESHTVAAPETHSKLIVDTGASLDLADKATQSRKEKEALRDADEPVTLKTANGKTESSEQIDRKVPQLGMTIEPHVLDNCPDVLSVGQRCQGEGFEFRWKPFSDRPYFV